MKNVKQFLAVLTAISLCASPIAVRAEDTTISNSSADKSANTLVSATINSEYSVRIPKTLTLSSYSSTKDSSYSVGAKGIIPTSKVLYVAPYAVLSPDNSKVSIVSKNGDTVDLTVTQNNTYFKNSNLSNSYSYNYGQVSGTFNKSGNYEGNMTFVVSLENNPEIKQPGLYQNEELIYKFTDSLAKEVDNKLNAVLSSLSSKANTIVVEINNENDAAKLSNDYFENYVLEILPNKYVSSNLDLTRTRKYKKIILPEGLLNLSNSMWSERPNLEAVVFPSSLVEIQKDAFRMCPKLSSVTFPENLKRIDDYAFYSYGTTTDTLKNITFNNKLEYVGNNSFAYCNMETLTFPDSLKYIDKQAFYHCEKLKTVIFPEGVELKNGSFQYCSELISVDIPDNTFINCYGSSDTIFSWSEKLKEITFGDNVTFTSSGPQTSCLKNEPMDKIHFTGTKTPTDVNSIDDSRLLPTSGSPIITFDDTITTIGKNCFRGSNCSNITWPTNLTTVEDGAFYGTKLPLTDGKIILPSTIKKIGRNAFEAVKSPSGQFVTVVIPDDVEEIGENAFLGLSHIEYHGSLVDDGSHWGAASIN